MRWHRFLAVVFGLLASWSTLAAWQYAEYRHERELIDEAIHQQSHSVMNAMIGGIRSHRRFGPFFVDQLQKMLKEMAAANDVLAVAVLASDGPTVFSAGSEKLIDGSPDLVAGDHWDDRGFLLVEEFALAPAEACPSGGAGGPGAGLQPWWIGTDEGGPFAEGGKFKAVILLDRTRTDTLARRSAWLHTKVAAAGGLALILAALVWWVSVKMVSARGQTKLLQFEASHLRELSQAAAGLAHETRNPLGLIRGWTQQIVQSKTLDANTGEQARAVIEECDRVTARINEFLAFAKPQSAQWERVDIARLVEELGVILQPDLDAKRLSLAPSIPPDAKTVLADRELLRQGLFNLLQNAIHFSPAGESVVVEHVPGSNGAGRIDVIDHGPGVDAGAVDSLFTPYYTSRPDGTGLGLAIVQRIASAHGWSAGYRPGKDRGAVFYLDGVHG